MKIENINEISDWMKNIRRDFHMHPELGMEEFRTAKKIKEYLDELGIENEGIATTGVVGKIKGRKPGKTIAIRADIDALMIEEVKGRSHGSKTPGVMHACGHDAHAAILLGSARALNNVKDSFDGEVRLLFQPAEETVGGAEPMVAEGAMKDVNSVIGLHVMSYMETGKAELKYGKLNASSDTLKIKIKGTSCHGAYPHMGIDGIVMASHVVTALQSVVSRNISPFENVVISFGRINGGTQNNILAEEVNLLGTLRTTNEEVRAFAKERIKKIVEDTCSAFGGQGEVVIEKGYMSLTNTHAITKEVENSCNEILGKENIIFKEFPSLGVEDFSFFIDAASEGGAFFHLGCGNKEKNITTPAHNAAFDVDEECLKLGMEIEVKTVLNLLRK